LKRGFKAEAERIASEARGELGLSPRDRLDPVELAKHLGIPVLTMDELASRTGRNSFKRYLSVIDPDVFSAITIFVGRRRFIIHNEFHHPNRQASNISHEISHTLLEHEPVALVGSDGQRAWNPEMEQEAHWLGAALLVPREGAWKMTRAGNSIDEIAELYGVSNSLCSWRIQQTGIMQQLQRSRRWS
jgi:Zn-dependent peptidase ImmA (M78 family)